MATITGANLERFVDQELLAHGYLKIVEKHNLFENRHMVRGKKFASHVSCGTNIYNSERICDFLIINPIKYPKGLIIECKWQHSAGSVDEKYPFVHQSILKTGVPTIVVLDGGGYRKEAEEWFKAQVDHVMLLGVWSKNELVTFLTSEAFS